MSLGSNGIATYPTSSKTQKLKILWSSLFAGLTILNKCYLYLVKKFLCNHWLMRTHMHLATILKMSVVKRIGQNMFNTGEVQWFACLANQADRKHFALNTSERKLSRSKSLQTLLYFTKCLFVRFNRTKPRFVKITDWSFCR